MSDALPINFTDAAANKVKSLVTEEENPNLKLRVYILVVVVVAFSMVSHLMKK